MSWTFLTILRISSFPYRRKSVVYPVLKELLLMTLPLEGDVSEGKCCMVSSGTITVKM